MALKGLSLSETHKCLHQGYTINDVNTQGSSSCYPLASSLKKKTKHNLFIWLTRPQPLVLSVCGVETQHNTETKRVCWQASVAYRRKRFVATTRSNFSRSSAAGISGVLTLAGCQQIGFVCQTSLQSPLFVVSRRCTLAQTDVVLDWMQACTLTHHKK